MVAKEAARLLYTGAVDEYKQAKAEAAHSMGVEAMPSNYEVALELDILADEIEGEERKKLILSMRRDAVLVMRVLSDFQPRLIGSVWRGTARKGSDIDVTVYAFKLADILSVLEASGFTIVGIEEGTFLEGRSSKSQHVFVTLKDGYDVEVVVRPPYERGETERCDVYGDLKRGLSLPELENQMRVDPLRKFIPARRWK